jgi:hypothetical protein
VAKSVVIVDDIDESPGAKTVAFALDGQSYEIDLGAKNTKKLFDALAPFIEKATHVKASRSGTKTASRARPAVDREQNQAIRDWAEQQGKEVSARGRIPQAIIDEYNEAHK